MGILKELHSSYIFSLGNKKESLEYLFSEHLRMGASYWGVTALALMGTLTNEHKVDLIEFVQKCRRADGSYGNNIDHDSHITSTHYAILIALVCNRMDIIDVDLTSNWLSSLQNADGSFNGDQWGEVDSRFSYNAVAALSLLNKLDTINKNKAAEYIFRCKNADEGFGAVPGGESHAAYTFCCVAAMSLLGRLHEIDANQLGWWLAQRQTSGGGFNGRPEKAPDVCYSWWILSALCVLGKINYIDKEALVKFIQESQDEDEGGIGDRPGNVADVFHTFFGLAGISLLEGLESERELLLIDSLYSIPVESLPVYCQKENGTK